MADRVLVERLRALREACEQGQKPEELVPHFAKRWALPEEEVDFYFSAMGSYQLRDLWRGMGTRVTHDRAHRRVFAALDVITGKPPPTLLQRLRALFGS